MEFRFGNRFLVLGSQPARMLRSNERDVKSLIQNCDPEPLVYLSQHSDRWFGWGKALTSLVYFNCAAALLASGNEDTAMNMAEVLLPHTSEGRALLYLILSQGHTQLEQWEEAIESQNFAMSYYNRLEEKQRLSMTWTLQLNGYTLQLHNGDTDELEKKCQNLLNTAPSPKNQVEAHLLLGKLYLAETRWEDAETHLTYAAEHGNKLLAQKEADLLLAQMRKTLLTKDQLLFSAQRAVAKDHFQVAVDLYQEALPLEGVDQEKEISARLNFSFALLALGRFEESLEQMEPIKPSSVPSRQAEFQVAVLYRQAMIYTELGRMEEATEAQNQAVALFEEHKLEGYRHVLCRSGLQLKIKRGELEGLEKETEALLENTPSDFWKMSAHMVKANYLLAADRGQEAKPHLEYVVEHGGEHHFVREAQAALNSL